jgi:hypothetical protein
LLISLAAAAVSNELTVRQIMSQFGVPLCQGLTIVVGTKLLFEGLVFTHLAQKRHTPLKRTALLMTGELSLTTLKRFFLGAVGGIVAPGLLLAEDAVAGPDGFNPLYIGGVVMLSLASLLIGELLERYLFFTAVVAPKMPGSPAS